MNTPTQNGDSAGFVVAALYRFATFPEFEQFREPLRACMVEHDVRGTLLLAAEGINGTIAGTREGVDAVIALIEQDPRFTNLAPKESFAAENPFYRTKVKLKREIVTMGVDSIDPNKIVGTYVEPQQWNELIDDPEVLLLDTRNKYEVEIGTFESAVNPQTESFREVPDYVKRNVDPKKHKKVAMFCTGGIRCEKSTAYLREQGFDEVYHLKGGILKYLEEVPEQETKWRGECFVFDNRVTVNHRLEQGEYDQCHACRMPISEADKQREEYSKGVSCHYCAASKSREKVKGLAERERQMQLAKQRGESHIGHPMEQTIEERKAEKRRFKESQREYERSKQS
jgi:UPF0176 protein